MSNSNKKKEARIAGALYFVLVLSGMFSLLYVPSILIRWDDAAETHKNIISNEGLFRLGILGDIVMATAFLFLSLAVYKLLHAINRGVAMTMVVLVMVSVAVSYVSLIFKLDVVSLVFGTHDIGPLDATQRAHETLALLRSHNNGIYINQIFWGLWLFPFGFLVYKSGFLPKIFGILLMIGCVGYLIEFLGSFLFPGQYENTLIPTIATIPHALGEIGTCLWLLIIGVRTKRTP